MNWKIKQWLKNGHELENSYQYYLKKDIIQEIPLSGNLTEAHLEKSDHNLEFSYYLIANNKFFDWAIVGLYYALYHASLALLAKKGFSSKDHTATICFLIKNYSGLSEEDIEFYDTLSLTKQDIEFYTTLKKERQNASYSTSKLFDVEHISKLRERTIIFINKVKSILDEE